MPIKRYNLTFFSGLIMLVILFSGYILTSGLTIIDSETLKNIIRIVVFAVGVFSLLGKKCIPAGSVLAILLGFLFFFINQSQFAINFSFLFFMILVTNDLEERHLALIVFLSTLCGILLHLVVLGLGVINAIPYEIGSRSRFTLGFNNANQLALIYLSWAISAAYLHFQYRTKWTMFSFVVAASSSGLAIYLSNSRTSLIALILLLSWMPLLRGRIFLKLTIFAGRFMPYVVVALTFAIVLNNDSSLNELLSNRPTFFSDFISSPDWLGYIFGWQNLTNITVDNAYLLLLSAMGAPFFLFAIVLLSKRIKSVDPVIIPIISTLLFVSVFESFLIRPEVPLALIVLWPLFSKRFPLVQN